MKDPSAAVYARRFVVQAILLGASTCAARRIEDLKRAKRLARAPAQKKP